MEPAEEGPVCVRCKTTSSLMWHKGEEGTVLCLECHGNADKSSGGSKTSSPQQISAQNSQNGHKNHDNGQQNSQSASGSGTNGQNRRTRLREKNSKSKQGKSGEKQRGNNSHAQWVTSRGQQKGRRTAFKQQKPMKAPKSEATVVTSDSIIHKGTTYEVGDVVSVLDRDGGVYYALIRGFLQDQYAEKYAVLTWLLPTQPNPGHFNPSIFVLGPEEDRPRSMEYLEFVCHSPQSRHFQQSYFHNLEEAELWTGTHRTPT